MNSIREMKHQMRKEMNRILNSLDSIEFKVQGNQVAEKVIQHRFFVSSRRVAFYLHKPKELHTTTLLSSLLTFSAKQQKECFIPVIVGGEMKMVKVRDKEDFLSFIPNRWNILEPPDSADRQDAISTGGLDLILCPGLAFDSKRKRLGRGGGYYDQYFASVEQETGRLPLSIGLAMNEQIVSEVPVEESDVVMDEIISPSISFPTT